MRGREEFIKTRISVTGSLGKELPIVGNPKPTIQIGCELKYKSSPLAIFWVHTHTHTHIYIFDFTMSSVF